ncbi:MAG: HAD family hydrolase [Bacteroidota bacterium]
MHLLLDAANTIIYKPKFYTTFVDVVNANAQTNIEIEELSKIHKIISECFTFPDKTSKEFYYDFNKELLYAFGIVPSAALLNTLFTSCSYLPWEKYEDTKWLNEINCEKSVLSNFHNGLKDIMELLFPGQFQSLTISENENCRKPDVNFYLAAVKKLDIDPSEIVYVGDSVKLDLEPAMAVGMKAFLIDRGNYYPHCRHRISSFRDLAEKIK